MIIGATLAKAVTANEYPLKYFLDQHCWAKGLTYPLFTCLVIGYPAGDAEIEGIVGDFLDEHPDADIELVPLDWGQDPLVAWDHENQYLELMTKTLEYAESLCESEEDWILKLDLDEFIHESMFTAIHNRCFENRTGKNSVLQFGYLFFLGSLLYVTPDPTWQVGKAYRIGCGEMTGDGMQIIPCPGHDAIWCNEVKTFHIGFVKSEELLTRRINEHVVNTKRFYPNIQLPLVFTYPKHRKGASAWPLGISGKKFAEYIPFIPEELPVALREHAKEFEVCLPRLE
jgi:hypothetical protein